MKLINTLRFSILALVFATHAASAAIINVAGTNENGDSMGGAVAVGDFNCDGFDDLAIGVSAENGSVSNAGGINVLYGGGSQLAAPGQQIEANLLTAAVANDYLGDTLAAGDFDGDTCDDLVVGVPYKDIGSAQDAGQVIILYGHPAGLNQNTAEVWDQNTAGVTDSVEAHDRFGTGLAVGYFNNDGYADLAIGIPGENNDAGAVYVMHGQPLAGVVTLASRFFTQDSSGIADTAESGDLFGHALASGDFDDNGYDDLAVGVPHENYYHSDDGLVHVLYSDGSSLSGSGSQLWRQGGDGLLGSASFGEEFGYSLAAGDFDANGHDDLVIGVPRDEAFSNCPYCSLYTYGGVHLLYGTTGGLDDGWNQYWQPDSPGIDWFLDGLFGHALAAGDFDDDGYDDLAIGAHEGTIGGSVNNREGMVKVLYGGPIVTTTGAETIHQNITNADGDAEDGDGFGYALAAGDFNGDGRADLAVGVPWEVYNGVEGGVAQVFYGQGTSGLISILGVNDQIFVQ